MNGNAVTLIFVFGAVFAYFKNTMSWFTKLLDRINGTGGGVKATNEKDKIPVNIFAGMEDVRFGLYSDNNKRNRKAQCW